MINVNIVLLLLVALFVACKVAYYYYKKNKINYNNYRMCLLALSDNDPGLKMYLSQKELLTKN